MNRCCGLLLWHPWNFGGNILTNFSKKPQILLAGVTAALVKPLGHNLLKSDERASTEGCFLTQDPSNQYENPENEKFDLETI